MQDFVFVCLFLQKFFIYAILRRELVPLFLYLLGWKKRGTEEAVSWFDSDVSCSLILGFDLPRAERRTRRESNWNCLILPMSQAYQHVLLKRGKTTGTGRGGYCHLIKLISCLNLSCTSQLFDNTTEYLVQVKFTKRLTWVPMMEAESGQQFTSREVSWEKRGDGGQHCTAVMFLSWKFKANKGNAVWG